VSSVRRRTAGGRRRRWRVPLAVISACLLVWFVAGWLVLVHPRTDQPRASDAILVLGPLGADGRMKEAIKLARAGIAPHLVISVANDYDRVHGYCAKKLPNVDVTCFSPNPPTTQGEARELTALAGRHNWRRVVVVTSRYHLSRARLILDRCYKGDLTMVASPGNPSIVKWAYQYGYQTAGFIKAALNTGC
jgi:uncharacterized SAM-binding protein YcdF (DUF218 family)